MSLQSLNRALSGGTATTALVTLVGLGFIASAIPAAAQATVDPVAAPSVCVANVLENDFACGPGASTVGTPGLISNSTAVGGGAIASQLDATAVGGNAGATGVQSTAIGRDAQSTAQFARVLGPGPTRPHFRPRPWDPLLKTPV
jgi:predicted outer membrane repeat protein